MFNLCMAVEQRIFCVCRLRSFLAKTPFNMIISIDTIYVQYIHQELHWTHTIFMLLVIFNHMLHVSFFYLMLWLMSEIWSIFLMFYRLWMVWYPLQLINITSSHNIILLYHFPPAPNLCETSNVKLYRIQCVIYMISNNPNKPQIVNS